MSILIVGASVAGTRTAIALRRRGFDGPIALLESERHWPYDKPPLSKECLAADRAGDVPPLLTPHTAKELNLEVRLGERASSVDPAQRVVRTATGAHISYQRLVIATGARARAVPNPGGLAGIHTLRTLDDAVALRSALDRAQRVVVVGAGFIGAESASAAWDRGLDVTLIEALDVPMSHILGAEIGREISSLHTIHSAHLLTGARVQQFGGVDRVESVELSDGRTVPADLVVAGVGAAPTTDWLEGSGLPIDDGVLCDENCEVVGFESHFAVGDLALRPHPLLGVAARIEHWTSAGEEAEIVAAAITGQQPPAPQLPYVWSAQYGSTIQIIGKPMLGALAHRDGAISDGRLRAVYTDSDNRPVGQVTVNDPKAFTAFRKNHRRGGSLADLLGEPITAR